MSDASSGHAPGGSALAGTARRVLVFARADDVPAALAAHTEAALREALAAREVATFCLMGGSTPGPAYRALARADLDWSRVHLFWGDERAVPPDHAQSNFRMARETLLDPLRARLPESKGPAVHRIEGERGAEAAAAHYDALLRAYFGGPPAFDVLHLGMGDDGHTASLFPGDAALDEVARLCAAATAPEGAAVRARVTLTQPALAHARQAFFAATGEGKREAFRRVLAGDDTLPATRVAAQALWLVDRALAGA